MEPYDRLQAGEELSESLMPPLNTGEMLAIRREELGYSMAQAAEALRIRYVYLQAIEDGRYHDLPGTAYAIGFVRSYAEFLGLDPEEAVKRFKQEIHGLERAPSLSFPVPKPEGKIPGGALILISLLLIALGYGAWYFLTTSGRQISDFLPSAAPVEESQEPSQLGDAALNGTGQPAAESTVPQTEDSQPSDTSEAETQTIAPAEGANDTNQSDVASGLEIASRTELGNSTAASPAETDTSLGSAVSDVAADLSEQSGEDEEVAETLVESETQTALVQPPSAPEPPTSVAPGGRVFGASNADARVVLSATSDSWVQVRDAEGELLLTQVLRTGDSFLVPNEAGITMRTGNAGGLSITVDGRPIASLGELGDVVDGVILEPDRLLNGTAVSPR